ncbi:MAG: 4Fe-4S binding protein [Deltaproteobacteria bacterium]|nr:4Fe-4S binding protein [Deltaproteobacteria bacterium]
MKYLRKIIEIDEERCNGCGQCVLSCAEGAIQIKDSKAKLVSEAYCDGLGACLGECPQGALRIVEREADDFDPEAVEHYLEEKKGIEKAAKKIMPCGCPSSNIQVLRTPCSQADKNMTGDRGVSALSHWPVQIRLVPANAPFLKDAHLLVAAGCTPVAYPDFHRDFASSKVILLGCPKFDDVQEYIRKFEEIFKTADIRQVTVLDMEVPCCSALPKIVRKGMQMAGKEVPMEEMVIGIRGNILQRKRTAA